MQINKASSKFKNLWVLHLGWKKVLFNEEKGATNKVHIHIIRYRIYICTEIQVSQRRLSEEWMSSNIAQKVWTLNETFRGSSV